MREWRRSSRPNVPPLRFNGGRDEHHDTPQAPNRLRSIRGAARSCFVRWRGPSTRMLRDQNRQAAEAKELSRRHRAGGAGGAYRLAAAITSFVDSGCKRKVDRPITEIVVPDVIRDAQGRFLPGTPSPHPQGRPALPVELRALARAETASCLQKLVELRDDPDVPAAVQLAATNALLDRAWGRPETRVEAMVEKRSTDDFSDEELMVIVGSADFCP